MLMRPSPTHRDRGSEIVEWGAALLLIGSIVAVLLAPALLPQTIQDNIAYAICRVFNPTDPGSCESPADRAFKPDKCEVSRSNESYGVGIDIAFFNVGRNLTFIRTVDSDGTTRVYAMQGGTVGVGTGLGAGVDWGAGNIGVGISGDLNLNAAVGDGWEFETPEQADEFIGEIQKRAQQDAVQSSFGLGGLAVGSIWEAVDPPDVPDPTIRRYQVGLSASAGAGGGLNLGEGRPSRPRGDAGAGPLPRGPNLNAGVTVNGSETAIVEQNSRTGETTVTMVVGGGVQGDANYVIDGNHHRVRADGVVSLTYDNNGNLKSLGLTRVMTDGNQAEVTSTTVPLETDADRQAVYDQLAVDQIRQAALNPNSGALIPATPLQLTWNDMAPVNPPGANATDLQRLLYERGQTTRTQNEFDLNDRNYGARVKAGLKLGLNVNFSDDQRNATDAQYLGAPGPGGQRQWKDFPECA
jgi:hypothetical protein